MFARQHGGGQAAGNVGRVGPHRHFEPASLKSLQKREFAQKLAEAPDRGIDETQRRLAE